MPKSKFREDIKVIGVPLTDICNREYSDPRQRQLFKNIIYVGALSALLDTDVGEMRNSSPSSKNATKSCSPRTSTREARARLRDETYGEPERVALEAC